MTCPSIRNTILITKRIFIEVVVVVDSDGQVGEQWRGDRWRKVNGMSSRLCVQSDRFGKRPASHARYRELFSTSNRGNNHWENLHFSSRSGGVTERERQDWLVAAWKTLLIKASRTDEHWRWIEFPRAIFSNLAPSSFIERNHWNDTVWARSDDWGQMTKKNRR